METGGEGAAFLWLRGNPVKLGSCLMLEPASFLCAYLGFLVMWVQKAIRKRALLQEDKILWIMIHSSNLCRWEDPRMEISKSFPKSLVPARPLLPG